MKATLVSHYSPRTRARVLRAQRARELLQSIQTPLVFVWCLALSGISTHQFCMWVSL